MSFLSNLFGKKEESAVPFNPIQVDMHCHLFPAIDDGAENYDESIAMVEGLYTLGYRKFIVTPHIMSDFYRNSHETIRESCLRLREVLRDRKIDVEIEPAAEYYLDEDFTRLLAKKDLLFFGKNYLLIETNYMNPMQNFDDVIFSIKLAGYTPVLAHPERYIYLYDNFDNYEKLFEKEVLFQVNLASFAGYYSPQAAKIAEKLVKNKMVHFIGTDIHHSRHLKPLKKAMFTKGFKQLSEVNLLNNSLL
jgi:protein-tyrosine phosphatase